MVAGVVVFAVTVGVVLRRARGGHATTVSPLRLLAGGLVTVTAIVAGGVLANIEVETPPEQLGMSVVVQGAHVRADRGYDSGLFVTAAASVTDCGERVAMRYTLTPTAEFWIDNRDRLRDQGVVSFAVPDDDLGDVEVLVGDEDTVPLPKASIPREQEPVRVEERPAGKGLTVVRVTIPRWGRQHSSVTLAFTAAWTVPRSRLGGCYVTLPAITGLPTALTGARLKGRAAPLGSDVPERWSGSFFEISSEAADVHAAYFPNLEVSRGVTVLDIADYSVDEGLSSPPPTTNLQGRPAWTCRSTNVPEVDFLNFTDPGQPPADYMVKRNGSGGSFGSARLDALLQQSSCGSFVALNDSDFGTRRDLVLILVGAAFSLGIELLLTGVRRKRSERAA